MIQEKKCKGEGKALGFGCGEITNVKFRKYGLGKKCGCFDKWKAEYLKENPPSPKLYKCRGTGQAKGYGCGKLTEHRKYGLGKMCCYANWLLDSDIGKAITQKVQYQVQKPRLEFEKALKEKNDRKGITTLIQAVVSVFHQYVRLRDKGKNCIACNTPWKEDFQASHYYKAELYSTLKFHEDNVHSGCMECNLRKEGNLSEYSVNLPIRIGTERFENLNELAALEKKTSFKWCREELREIRDKYKAKLKELKK